MNTKIEIIEAQIAALDEKIRPLADERRKLQYDVLRLKSRFKVGDVITWEVGRHGKKRKGRVVEIRSWCLGTPMWLVENISADGSVSGAKTEVRDYQKPVLDYMLTNVPFPKNAGEVIPTYRISEFSGARNT